MKLLIDSRENKIIDKLDQNELSYEKKYLEIGDFILQDCKNQEVVIERKTWNDLQASITDNRYREQRSRLLMYSKNENIKICYLIEGCKNDSKYDIEKKALFRLIFAYKIPVFFTENINETIEFLNYFMKFDNFDSYFFERSIETDQVESRISTRIKKNYDNASIYFQEILCFLKGMTSAISCEIAKEWNSVQHFVSDFEKDEEVWHDKIQNIQYKTKQNNLKKINKNLIEKIKINFNFIKN